MKENYPGAYQLSEEFKTKLSNNAIFCFDTDMLQAIASLSGCNFSAFITLINKSKIVKRIWIPNNVDYKYHKDLLPTYQYQRIMTANLFTPKMIGKGFNKAQMAYLYKRAQERYDKRISPGRIGDGTDKRIMYHDYIIWKEMQRKAGEERKNIILVKKNIDYTWFEKADYHVYTNHTIVNEFYRETQYDFNLKEGCLFSAISIGEFLDLCYSKVHCIFGSFEELKDSFASICDFDNIRSTDDTNDVGITNTVDNANSTEEAVKK